MSSFGFQATGFSRHAQKILLLAQKCSLSSKWENKFISLQYHRNSLAVVVIRVPISYFDIMVILTFVILWFKIQFIYFSNLYTLFTILQTLKSLKIKFQQYINWI